MAQLFIKALLHPVGWNDFYIKMSQTGNVNIAVGAAHPMSAGWGILGAGQPGISGLALNACFLSPVSSGTTSIPKTSIDPPQPYTFCNALQPYGRDFLNLNLKMVRANDYSFQIQVILNGNPVNCTGGFLRFSAKWRAQDSDADEVFAIESPGSGIVWIDQTIGTATLTIARDLTNISAVPFHKIDLLYDLQLTNVAGSVATVMYGALTIIPNISQTSP